MEGCPLCSLMSHRIGTLRTVRSNTLACCLHVLYPVWRTARPATAPTQSDAAALPEHPDQSLQHQTPAAPQHQNLKLSLAFLLACAAAFSCSLRFFAAALAATRSE